MCAFNQVNHDWACGSDQLLDRILKREIGFDGWVVTDFGARHYLTEDPPSLRAGLDQELNAWRYWTPMAIKELIAPGGSRVADVDEAAYRIVRAHIASGLFDVPRIAAPDADVSTPQSEAFARTLAERGAVLLKNAGVLPLSGSGGTIAVVGPTAANTPATGDIDASSVCLHTAPNIPCTAVAPLDSITARAATAGATVTYADGSDLAAAAATAAAADVAVVFGYYREGEFADRPNISLDGDGDALIGAVAAANPNTVVVLQTGGPGPHAVDRLGRRRAGGLVRRGADGPRHRRAAVGRRRTQRQAPALLPPLGGRPADRRRPRAVPGHVLRRVGGPAAGQHRAAAGRVHRGPAGRLPLVRARRTSSRCSRSATA